MNIYGEGMHLDKRKIAIGFLCGSILILLAFSISFGRAQGAAPLQISYINVGEGDSILLRDPEGFTLLIDGGKTTAGPAVVNYIKSRGISSIDVILATHADADHIGGLIDVLQDNTIAVQRVLYNGYAGTTQTWNNFLAAVTNKGLTLEAAQFPETLQFGALTVWVMNPAAGLSSPDSNQASVVLKILYGSKAFLFTGDIDTTIEATVIARQTPTARPTAPARTSWLRCSRKKRSYPWGPIRTGIRRPIRWRDCRPPGRGSGERT